ncbi:MAG: 30S ribosome-binding factor RbfA [Bacteroidota bacterium]
MSVRSEKVASVIKQEVGNIFQRNFGMQEFGFMTVTEVRMSPDLKIAKIHVSVFGDEKRKAKSLALLEEQKAFIRSEIGNKVRLKFTPSIVFYLDESLDRAMHIEHIINEIHQEREGGDPDDGG